MNCTVLHNDHRTSIFYALCGVGILLFCVMAGCVGSHSSSNTGAANLTNLPATDVIIPVDSPSALSSTSNMQKGGIPAGSLIYEGLVIKDRNGKFDPSLALKLECFRRCKNMDISSHTECHLERWRPFHVR